MTTFEDTKQNGTTAKQAFPLKRKYLLKTINEHDEVENVASQFEEYKNLHCSAR